MIILHLLTILLHWNKVDGILVILQGGLKALWLIELGERLLLLRPLLLKSVAGVYSSPRVCLKIALLLKKTRHRLLLDRDSGILKLMTDELRSWVKRRLLGLFLRTLLGLMMFLQTLVLLIIPANTAVIPLKRETEEMRKRETLKPKITIIEGSTNLLCLCIRLVPVVGVIFDGGSFHPGVKEEWLSITD